MIRIFYLPAKNLRRFIDRYWCIHLTENKDIDCLDVFPGTGADLLFNLRDPLIQIHSNNEQLRLENSHIICPREGRTQILLGKNTFLVAVRFRSWALCNFCNIPISNLKNAFIPSSLIWDENRITQMMENLILNQDELNIVSTLDDFLQEELNKNYKNNEAIFDAVDQIYYHCDQTSIRSLSNECEISNRHFRRKFIETMGVSPKQFHKIVRFQHIVKHSMLNKRFPCLDDALRLGYFDQSHFIKDFTHFTHQTPGLFFKKNLQKSHFYNKSLTPHDKILISQ